MTYVPDPIRYQQLNNGDPYGGFNCTAGGAAFRLGAHSKRRDGALGVFRFTLEQLSRHWQPLVAVLVASAGAALAIAGNIRVEVAVR